MLYIENVVSEQRDRDHELDQIQAMFDNNHELIRQPLNINRHCVMVSPQRDVVSDIGRGHVTGSVSVWAVPLFDPEAFQKCGLLCSKLLGLAILCCNHQFFPAEHCLNRLMCLYL